jgi:O-methyltransferase
MRTSHYFRRVRSLACNYAERRRRNSIYDRYKSYTMIPRHLFAVNLSIASRISHIPGCIVECGVWRGGMSAGIATILGTERTYYLCDSFEGLPPAQPIDGEKAIAWQNNVHSPHYFDNCSAPESYAHEAMTLAGNPPFHLIKGWFNETLPKLHTSAPIALLRLDGDWYDSTMTCLTALYDKVATGGLIVLDDYYTWDGCSRATHDFLSARSSPDRIRSESDVCFIIKSPKPNTFD